MNMTEEIFGLSLLLVQTLEFPLVEPRESEKTLYQNYKYGIMFL